MQNSDFYGRLTGIEFFEYKEDWPMARIAIVTDSNSGITRQKERSLAFMCITDAF